jgi:hypothetical protein
MIFTCKNYHKTKWNRTKISHNKIGGMIQKKRINGVTKSTNVISNNIKPSFVSSYSTTGVIPLQKTKRYVKNPLLFVNVNKNENFAYGSFMYFFKHFITQPFIRKVFVNKYNPDIDYFMYKLRYNDDENVAKINEIKQIIQQPKDFIIDIAQQYESGSGHYTSLKRKNNMIEYMDSDPFFYGSEENSENSLYDVVKNYKNPINIYGDGNVNKRLKLKAKKSIQNLNKLDTFCQSWSLLFITLDNISSDYKNIYEQIKFQENTFIPHTSQEIADSITDDNELKQLHLDAIQNTINNFQAFKHNFLFLISFWIFLINDNKDTITETIKNNTTQFIYWKPEEIILKLQEIGEYVKTINDQHIFEDEVCLYDNIDNYTITLSRPLKKMLLL